MNLKTTLLGLAALTGLTLGGLAALRGAEPAQDAPLPELPDAALGVRDVLFVRPFTLDEPYVHAWRAERPEVDAGFILVLEVEQPFTIARDSLESVLYVGEQVAERLNWGTGSGRVVALVPAPRGAEGEPELDLEAALMWYGTPALPERVDSARVDAERDLARAGGVEPLGAASLEAAREAGGELVHLPDRTTLERYAAGLILEYSPSEAARAEGLLAPLLR